MGAFTVKIEVGGLEGQQSESLEALVDSGFQLSGRAEAGAGQAGRNGHRASPVHAGG